MRYFLMALLLTTSAWATTPTDKQIDSIQNSISGSALAVPSTGTTFATDSNTLTLTNKSISGSTNTFSSIPVSAIATGTGLSVASGGTGDVTLTTNGMLFGNGTSAVGITSAGSQYQSFQAGASGVPTIGALHLDQSAATTGILPVAAGGLGVASPTTGGILIGAGSSPVTSLVGTVSGQVPTWNGSTWTAQAPGSSAPNLNGTTAASPQSVAAVTGISLTGLSYVNVIFAVGAVPSTTTTVTATPSITACTAAGQILYIISESATALFKLQNQADLAGSQLLLNGPWTSGENNSTPNTLTLMCDGAATPNWVEIARQQ